MKVMHVTGFLLAALLLSACSSLSGPVPIVEAKVIGESEQNSISEDGGAYGSIDIRNVSSVEDLEIIFTKVPEGMSITQIQAKWSPTVEGLYFLGYSIDATTETALGRYTIDVLVRVQGVMSEVSWDVEVIPQQPSMSLVGFEISARYESYPSIIAYVESTYIKPMDNVSISASCTEDGYPNLTTSFSGVATVVELNTVTRVSLSYSNGFPYFTDNTVRCRFRAYWKTYSFDLE